MCQPPCDGMLPGVHRPAVLQSGRAFGVGQVAANMPRIMSEGTHSYYDWQVSTLLLAYDVVDPIAREDVEGLAKRQQDVELELHQMVHAILPADYRDNPGRDFPPALVIELTRATLRRASAIAGLI